MIKRRFNIRKPFKNWINDDFKNYCYCLDSNKDAEHLCNLLNALYEENQRLTDKLNDVALELVDDVICVEKAVEISEMNYRNFLEYRNCRIADKSGARLK